MNIRNVIENESELSYYEEVSRKIKKLLTSTQSISFSDLLRYAGGSDRRVLRLLRELESDGILSFSHSTITSKIFVAKKTVTKQELTSRFDKVVSRRPIPTFFFDQRPVTVSTTIERTMYMVNSGDLDDKEILIVGDDDLQSICLAMMNVAKRIVVIDIDERLIDFINTVAKEENLVIEAFVKDAYKPDFSVEGNFSVIITDPTPQSKPFEFFIDLCAKQIPVGGFGYLSFYPSHQFFDISFQQTLTKHYLVITEMIPKLSEYAVISNTYNAADLKYLEEKKSTFPEFSFHENFVKVQKVSTAISHEHDDESKAMKRVIQNPQLDPALSAGDKYVEGLVKSYGR